MRSLLRWSSLGGGAGLLYALGVWRLHLHDFPAFLAILLGVSLAVVAVFLVTREDGSP